MPSVIPGFSIIVDNGVRGVKRAGLGRSKKQTSRCHTVFFRILEPY